MQTLLIIVRPAIDHLKTIVYRRTGPQWSSSPCRCNLSMQSRPRSRAPTMFLLIISVRLGHVRPPVILYITHICPNKGAHLCTWTMFKVQIGHSQTQRHGHYSTHKQNCFQCPASCAIAIHAQAVRQHSKVFITIDVRNHNKKWWLNLLQSVLFKAKLFSPSCCSLSSVGRGGCDD